MNFFDISNGKSATVIYNPYVMIDFGANRGYNIDYDGSDGASDGTFSS
jgi:hypothetical protein